MEPTNLGTEPFQRLASMYLRIRPDRIHFLKFILESYDGLCLLSTQDSKSGLVVVRYPHGMVEEICSLLADLAPGLCIPANGSPDKPSACIPRYAQEAI